MFELEYENPTVLFVVVNKPLSSFEQCLMTLFCIESNESWSSIHCISIWISRPNNGVKNNQCLVAGVGYSREIDLSIPPYIDLEVIEKMDILPFVDAELIEKLKLEQNHSHI